MIPAPKPVNELQRISALHEYNILDTIPEEDYDDITKIAAEICNMPISLISIIDADRQWFKSRVGLDVGETHRDLAFCAYAILDPAEMFVVEDSSKDERFADNPLVTNAPNVSFYAGVPLVDESGMALGTLCVIDQKPNQISEEQKTTLKALARQIVAYLEIRKKNLQLEQQKEEIEKLNKELEKFAYIVAHDIKGPCGNLIMATDLLKDIYGGAENEEGTMVMNVIEESGKAIIKMIDGILQHTITINKSEIEKEKFTFGNFMEEVKTLLQLPKGFTLEYANPETEIYTSRYMLMQVVVNLCTNGIKYNSKDKGLINVSVKANKDGYIFTVTDNGIGIKAEDQGHIFDLFSTLGVTDRNNNKGTGIGLSTVKRLVQKLGGEIKVSSVINEGSTFEFSVAI